MPPRRPYPLPFPSLPLLSATRVQISRHTCDSSTAATVGYPYLRESAAALALALDTLREISPSPSFSLEATIVNSSSNYETIYTSEEVVRNSSIIIRDEK